MGRYVLRRLLSIVPVILGVTIVVFLLIKLVPGDVASVLLGPEATPVEIEALHKALGLDEPLQVQYFRWLGSAIQGDLGDSIEYRVPVQALIFDRLGNTLILTLTALFLSTSVGVTIGVISATRQHSFFDRIGMLVALFGNSMPAFWLGMLLILTFSLRLSWFPVGGMYSIRGDEGLLDLAHHLVLPAITLGSLSMAIIARMTRSCMLDVLTQDYVWSARAKGLKEHTRRPGSCLAQCFAAGCHCGGLAIRHDAGWRRAHRDRVFLAGSRAPDVPGYLYQRPARDSGRHSADRTRFRFH